MPLPIPFNHAKAATLLYIAHDNNDVIQDVTLPKRYINHAAYVQYVAALSDDEVTAIINYFSVKTQEKVEIYDRRWQILLKPSKTYSEADKERIPRLKTDSETAAAMVDIFRKYFHSPEADVCLPYFLKPFPSIDGTAEEYLKFYNSKPLVAQQLFIWFSLHRAVIEQWYKEHNLSYKELLQKRLKEEIRLALSGVVAESSEGSINPDTVTSRFIDQGNLKDILVIYSLIESANNYFKDDSNFVVANDAAIKEMAKIISEELIPLISEVIIETIPNQSTVVRNKVIANYALAMVMPLWEYANDSRGYISFQKMIGAYLHSQLMQHYIMPHITREIETGKNIENIFEELMEGRATCERPEHFATIYSGVMNQACLSPDIFNMNDTPECTDAIIDKVVKSVADKQVVLLPKTTMYNKVLDLSNQCLTDDVIPELRKLLILQQYDDIGELNLSFNEFTQEGIKNLVEFIRTSKPGIIRVLYANNLAIEDKESILKAKTFDWSVEFLETKIHSGKLDLSHLRLCDDDILALIEFLTNSEDGQKFLSNHSELCSISLVGNFLSGESAKILSRLSAFGKNRITEINLEKNAFVDFSSTTETEKVKSLLMAFPLLKGMPITSLKDSDTILASQLETQKQNFVKAAAAIFCAYRSIFLEHKDNFTFEGDFKFPPDEAAAPYEECYKFFDGWNCRRYANNLVHFFYQNRHYLASLAKHEERTEMLIHSQEELNNNSLLCDVLIPLEFINEIDDFLAIIEEKDSLELAAQQAIRTTAEKLLRLAELFGTITNDNSLDIWKKICALLRPLSEYVYEGQKGVELAGKQLYWEYVFQGILCPSIEDCLKNKESLDVVLTSFASGLKPDVNVNKELINTIYDNNKTSGKALVKREGEKYLQRRESYLENADKHYEEQKNKGRVLFCHKVNHLEYSLSQIAKNLPGGWFGREGSTSKKLTALVHEMRENQAKDYSIYRQEAMDILKNAGEYKKIFELCQSLVKYNMLGSEDRAATIMKASVVAYAYEKYLLSKGFLKEKQEGYKEYKHFFEKNVEKADALLLFFDQSRRQIDSWYWLSNMLGYGSQARLRQLNSQNTDLNLSGILPSFQKVKVPWTFSSLFTSVNKYQKVAMEDLSEPIRRRRNGNKGSIVLSQSYRPSIEGSSYANESSRDDEGEGQRSSMVVVSNQHRQSSLREEDSVVKTALINAFHDGSEVFPSGKPLIPMERTNIDKFGVLTSHTSSGNKTPTAMRTGGLRANSSTLSGDSLVF